MLRFEPFIGVWNTTGQVLATEAAPASALAATDIYRWLPGKHFIVHDVDARFGNVPTRSMEVIGYEPSARKYFAHSFDDQGSSERFTVELSGDGGPLLERPFASKVASTPPATDSRGFGNSGAGAAVGSPGSTWSW